MSVASTDTAVAGDGRAVGPAADSRGPASAGIPSGRLNRLEALRGLAAVYVVLHHVMPGSLALGGMHVGWVFRFGQEAVILFFLLSGFVIHYAHRRARDRSFRTYLLKRGLRIYVPLIVVLALSWLLASLAAGRAVPADGVTLMGNLLMLQDWAFAKPNVIVGAYMDNGPLWSLSYEWWFYLMYWPIARFGGTTPAPGARRRRDVILLVITVLAAAAYCVWPTFVPRVVMYFGIWWSGVMLADAWLDGRIRHLAAFVAPGVALAASSAVLALNVLQQRGDGVPMLLGVHPVLELRHFAFALVALGVAFVWQHARWVGFGWLVMPFARVAPISYSLYITHHFMLAHAGYLAWLGQPVLEFVAYFLIMLLVCWAVELRLYPAVRRHMMARFATGTASPQASAPWRKPS